jgi:hypothetical protein
MKPSTQDEVFAAKARQLAHTAEMAREEAEQYARDITDKKLRKQVMDELDIYD